jgi:AcrR family transcriptional regulator
MYRNKYIVSITNLNAMSKNIQVSMNVERKPDRRVIRTRTLLRDALMALILERGYDNITVQDIADRANLGRATFYLHFSDKEELLVSSLKETFDGLMQAIAPLSFSPENDPRGIAFKHAAENRDFYRVMLSGQGTGSILKEIRAYIAQMSEARIRQIMTQFPDLQPNIPIDILSQYIGGALLSLIVWWLESDTAYSTEYMTETFRRLSRQAIVSAFSPQNFPEEWLANEKPAN